jgi:hypothetical protein
MLARLGNLLYWTGCALAALILAFGWMEYPGVDTTGIEAARQSGLSDTAIVQQRLTMPSTNSRAYESAAKAGYSPTEILDYLVRTNRSRLAALPDLQQNPRLMLAAAAALLAWVVGRALRYLLAGT